MILPVQPVHELNIDQNDQYKGIDRPLLSKPESQFEATQPEAVQLVHQHDAKQERNCEPYRQKNGNRLSLLLVSFLFLAQNALSQEPTVEQIIEDRIFKRLPDQGVQVGGLELFSQIEMPKFYTNRSFEPAWDKKKNIEDLMESIESAYDEGLDPEDYHYQKITELLAGKEGGTLSNADKADLDMLLTDATILYAAHLLEGKLEQSELRRAWDVEKNARPENVDSLLTVTLHNNRLKPALQAMKPSHYIYTLLKLHLKQLRERAEEGGWPQVSGGEKLEKDMDSRSGSTCWQRVI